MRKPAARAKSGMASPSSQDACCGSPHAICTTSMPSRSRKRFSSVMFLTCSDQLQTPMVSGSMAIVIAPRKLSARRRLDGATQRAERLAAVANLVECANLVRLQLGDFLGAGPDDGPSRRVRFHHELKRAL